MTNRHRQDLNDYLNKILMPQNFQDYGPNGLQFEGKDNISKVAFTLSSSTKALTQAKEWGADAIIVHHGLIWKFHSNKTFCGPYAKKIKILANNDINFFAYHLPLDGNQEFGNGVTIAKRLGLKKIREFGKYKKSYIGAQGELESEIPAKDLKTIIEKLFDKKIIFAADESKKIKKVAIVTGGGGDYWKEAKNENIDAFITGELREHELTDAFDEGIALYAAGHTDTEELGLKSLMNKVEKDLNLEVIFIKSDNPL